jgi:N-acetylmuramoyl-L-alanine amidase
MLKTAVIFLSVLMGLAGCALLTPYRDPNQPLPPNWDISQVSSPVKPPALPPPPLPPPKPVELPVPQEALETNHFEETWIKLNRWASACGFPSAEKLSLPPLEMSITNGFQWKDFNLKARTSLIPLTTFSLQTTNGTLVIQPETRTAHWDEVEIHLGFAPELVQGEPLMHTLDLSKTIEPLLQITPELPDTNRIIVIDPDDDVETDGVPADLLGKNFALDWAQRLAALLTTNGWTVFITHTNGTNASIADRAAFAEMHRADLFLNLCFGSLETDANQSGIETYCLAPASMPSNVPRTFFEETWHTFPNNAYDLQNWQYAFRLHRALIQIPGAKDRGLRRSRFIKILRGRTYPAVRVSGGHLANAHAAALIANPIFRQKLAAAIASALP